MLGGRGVGAFEYNKSVSEYGDNLGVEGGSVARYTHLTDREKGASGKVGEGVSSSCFDGKGGKIKEARVGQGNGVAVGHGDGDGRCCYLTIGVWCLDGYIVAGAAGVGNEARC